MSHEILRAYDIGDLLGKLPGFKALGFGGGDQAQARVESAAQDTGAERRAQEEAQRKSRAAAAARGGRRATLLTGSAGAQVGEGSVGRKTLLGGGR